MNEIFFIGISFLFLVLSIKKNDAVYFIACVVLIFLSAYRGLEVGTDVLNYKMHFEVISSGGLLPIEPLWIGLNLFVDYLGGEYREVLILSSLIILVPIFYTVYKESKNPMLSLFLYYSLYFYLSSFNLISQSIAASLILLGFVLLKDQKKKSFIALVCIAGLFHYSAFIALGALIIEYFPKKTIIYISVVIISLIMGLYYPQEIFKLVTSIFPYEGAEKYNWGNFLGNAIFQAILTAFFIYILFVIRNKKDFYFNLFFLSVIVSNIAARVPLGYRILVYFSLIQILLLPNLVYDNRVKQKIVVISIVILYTLVMFFRKFGADGVFPYENIYL